MLRVTGKRGADDLLPLTVPEVRRLLLALTEPPERFSVRLGWSLFRRRHQAVAKACHIARRTHGEQPPATSGTALTLSTPTLVLTDAHWQQISALLPSPKDHGRPPVDSFSLLAGILWIIRTGAPWRAMPTQFGHWHTAYTRYQDWQRAGLWTTILAILQAPDTEHSL